MNESAKQQFLTKASEWLDFYGPYCYNENDPHSLIDAIDFKVKGLEKDPLNRQDLVLYLVLYTCALWRTSPEFFTNQEADLTTPPDNTIGQQTTQYVLETIISRCARLPRWADVNLGAGYIMTDIEFPDPPGNSDKHIIETIIIYFATLQHAVGTETTQPILDILLTGAWELYLRAWESNKL